MLFVKNSYFLRFPDNDSRGIRDLNSDQGPRINPTKVVFFSGLPQNANRPPLRSLPGEADPQGIPMTLHSSLPKRIATQNRPPKPSQ